MKEMEGKTLQEYLYNAILLETDIAIQDQIKRSYQANAEKRKPILNYSPLPKEPKLDKPSEPDSYFFFSLIAGSLCLGFGFVFQIVGYNIPLLWIGGILFMLPWLFKKLNARAAKKEAEETYIYALEKYKTECEKIEEKRVLEKRDFDRDFEVWKRYNNKNIKLMDAKKTESERALDKLYALDVIYPKYRSLPALTSIYEYLVIGRCNSLTGPDGAYNLYENEIRANAIIWQLSVVIKQLEQIKQNQYALYQQVKEIQSRTNAIERELQQIKGYAVEIASLTALNTFYAATTERNTRITMWCNV